MVSEVSSYFEGLLTSRANNLLSHQEVVAAMMYTIAKQIGAMYVAMTGQVEAIILTGGIAHSDYCMDILRRQVDYLAPVVIVPGENEMGSLAYNALGVLRGELPLQEYK